VLNYYYIYNTRAREKLNLFNRKGDNYMFTFTLFVFVISGLALLLGIFFPKQTLFWGRKKTRSKVILTYLPIMLLAFSANTATSGIGLSEKIANIEAEINQVEQDYEQKGT